MSRISSLMRVMIDVSNKASRFLSRDYYELKSLQSSKRPTDFFVDRSIKKISDVILYGLEKGRPEFGIECNGTRKESTSPTEEKWLVTLMDGVENFAHSIPCFAMSIAVSEKRNDKVETIATLISLPILDELYFAERNQGAWSSGVAGHAAANQRLRVAERKDNLLICCDEDTKFNSRDFGSQLMSCAYVASGKIDLVKTKHLSRSSLEAAKLLILEAGGVFEEKGEFITFSTPNSQKIIK